MTREQAVKLLKQKQGGLSLRGFALHLGVSAAYLSDVFRGNREIGPKLLKHVGLKQNKTTTVVYERIK